MKNLILLAVGVGAGYAIYRGYYAAAKTHCDCETTVSGDHELGEGPIAGAGVAPQPTDPLVGDNLYVDAGALMPGAGASTGAKVGCGCK
jgi:hypothetical protein